MTNRDNDIRKAERARENYPPRVLLYPCPKCGEKSGAWCRKSEPGKRKKVLAAPHDERIRLARLGLGGR